jgi:hypothetical protein
LPLFSGGCATVGLEAYNKATASSRTWEREGITMPAVRITSDKQYEKAIEVLDRVGGTWQGVGYPDRFLLVSPRLYEALVRAKVVTPQDSKKPFPRGNNTHKTPTS